MSIWIWLTIFFILAILAFPAGYYAAKKWLPK